MDHRRRLGNMDNFGITLSPARQKKWLRRLPGLRKLSKLFPKKRMRKGVPAKHLGTPLIFTGRYFFLAATSFCTGSSIAIIGY